IVTLELCKPLSECSRPASGASLHRVILPCVFLDHAPGVELRYERDHGAADFLNPLARDPVGIAIEEAGDDFLSQRLVKVFTVLPVLFLNRVGMGIIADGKAIRAVVAFAPPAVQNAEVEASMGAGFHAAGARGLQRAARVVQPHVAAGTQLP